MIRACSPFWELLRAPRERGEWVLGSGCHGSRVMWEVLIRAQVCARA